MIGPGTPLGEYLAKLPGDLCRHLAASLGADNPDKSKRDLIPRLERWLEDPERIQALPARLSGPGRQVLELLCEAPDLLPDSWLVDGVLGCLGSSGRAGFQEVSNAGLLVETGIGPRKAQILRGLLPPLARALRRLFDGLWLDAHPSAAPDHSQVELLDLQALALLAQLANQKPKTTTQGAVFKAALKKLEPLFPGGGAAVQRRLAQLGSLGLLSSNASGRLYVDARKLSSLLSRPADEVLLENLSQTLRAQMLSAQAVLRFLARRPGWHSRERVFFVYSAHAARFSWGGSFPYALQLMKEQFEGLLAAPFVELSPDGKQLKLVDSWIALLGRLQDGVAPAPPAPAPLAPCLLQPNFELIVPREASPLTVFEVGRLGRLKYVDRAATFVLDERSIRSAAADGLSAEAMLETLGRACAHGVPQNVAQGIRDFAAGVKRVSVLVGLVAVLPAGEPPPGPPFLPTGVPGVFLADPCEQRASLSALERQGYSVDYRQSGGPGGPLCADPDAWDDEDDEEESESGLERFLLGRGPAPEKFDPLRVDPRAWLRETLELTSDTRPFSGVAMPPPPIAAPSPAPSDRPTHPGARPASPEDINRALREQSDLRVWTPGDRGSLRVTPHFMSLRGKAWHLAGHVVDTEEFRLFPLGDTLLSVGERSRPDDLRLAAAARSLRSTERTVDRNDPCPCGSGRKYKKCCLDAPLSGI